MEQLHWCVSELFSVTRPFRSTLHIRAIFDKLCVIGHSHREEYIQEDGGLMFRGVYNRIKPTPWNYAQYERDVLECALYLVREIGKVGLLLSIR